MKRKFKVGNKVKNIKNLSGIIDCDKFIGLIGEIDNIGYDRFYEDFPYFVKFNNGGKEWFNDDELELVKEEYVTKAEFEEFKKSMQEIKSIKISDESIGCVKEEKPKDRADKNQRYWYLNDMSDVCSYTDKYDEVDNYHYKIGNYYLTEEECKRAKEIQDILLKYSYRFSTEELENTNVEKYEIFADIDAKKIKMHQMYYCLSTNFKFNNQENCQKAIYKIGYEDYIKYCVRGNIK